ncbi:hypothetical protein D3C72_2535170 [compost metagenome]
MRQQAGIHRFGSKGELIGIRDHLQVLPFQGYIYLMRNGAFVGRQTGTEISEL